MNALHVELNRLLGIMDDLRLKCPWDQKQTLESLRHLTLEETYELSDALLKKDVNQIERHLQLAEEEIKRLKQELKEWKSQEVRERFESVGSMAHLVHIEDLELKIKRLKRGEDI